MIAAPFRNTADDPAAQDSHYQKFCLIRRGELPGRGWWCCGAWLHWRAAYNTLAR
jgi:hypothetical protein